MRKARSTETIMLVSSVSRKHMKKTMYIGNVSIITF